MTKPRKSMNDAMDVAMAVGGGSELPAQEAPAPTPMPERPFPMPDGRSLRATGRTHQFSTRIKLETHNQMKWLALNERITLGELLEKMVETYKKDRNIP